MIATFLFGLLLAGQAQPQAHSAQCLIEVAALTSEDFDIRNDRMRGAAIAKTDSLMTASRDLLVSLAEVERTQAASLAAVERQETAGELPAGSSEVTRARIARERAEHLRQARRLELLAPSCDWPAVPTS